MLISSLTGSACRDHCAPPSHAKCSCNIPLQLTAHSWCRTKAVCLAAVEHLKLFCKSDGLSVSFYHQVMHSSQFQLAGVTPFLHHQCTWQLYRGCSQTGRFALTSTYSAVIDPHFAKGTSRCRPGGVGLDRHNWMPCKSANPTSSRSA